MLIVYAPHFVAAIDGKTTAPILRRSCSGKTQEQVINWCNQKGYQHIMIVTGKVDQVIERPTKFGPYYDIVVDGRKYGTGKKKPPCSDGDYVTFEAEAKGDFFNANPTTFKKVVAPVTSGDVSIPAKSPAKSAWVPEKDRQDTISYQAARNAAIEFVDLLFTAGKIDFGKMKGAEAVDLLETYVDNYTQRFFKDTKNLGHVEPKSSDSVDSGDVTPSEIEEL